jgi:hypothetical protein
MKKIKKAKKMDIMKMSIRDFFELSQKGGQYEVKTPQGWKPIGELYLKKQKECYLLRLEESSLGCSFDHLVMTEKGWKIVENINVETDKIETSDGFKRISANEYIGTEDTYDWEVLSKEHAYYANGIVSHNTGKTAIVKQFGKKQITWRGKTYDGYKVFDVPIAQFEEMGDLHGLPSRHVLVTKQNGEGPVERWVPEEVIQGYLTDDWKMVHSAGVKTMYAAPDWVPSEPGPSILLLDDWNRTSVRIIKGIMQLLQNYGMVSWKLPEGCNIVLTGNPDEQDYLVTSIDAAILTRIRSVTLKVDAPEWAVWAQSEGIDPRLINFCLTYPEMMVGNERTNPRTLSEFGRCVKRITDLSSKDNQVRFKMLASSLLDEQTVSTIMVFMERDVEMIIEPQQVLAGEDWIPKHLKKLMSGAEKRIDVLGVICDRLYAYLVQPTTMPDKKAVKNFQDFLCIDDIPEDLRHNLCLRISRVRDNGKTQQWIMQNEKLKKLILEVI